MSGTLQLPLNKISLLSAEMQLDAGFAVLNQEDQHLAES
jgi:hypothetical protein